MKSVFLVAILLMQPLLAEIPPEYEASKERVINKQENYFITSTDFSIAPKVNPITGEYCEQEVDFIVAGVQPITIRRYYNHFSPNERRYGSWRYNPETFCVGNLDFAKKELFVAVGDGDGTVCSLEASKTLPHHFDFQKINLMLGVADGRSHPSNIVLCYSRCPDPKNKKRYTFDGTILDGSGRIRSFHSRRHCWRTDVEFGETWWHNPWIITPDVWTPYELPIIEEKLPNGNIICYETEKWIEADHDRYPRPELIKKIVAYNSTKTKVLGEVQFTYDRFKNKRDGDVQSIKCSDGHGRCSVSHHTSYKSNILLNKSRRADQTAIDYGFTEEGYIKREERPGGRVLTTEYVHKSNKVKAQYATVGPNGELCPIGIYAYYHDSTTVTDAENNKVIYRFDENKRITSIDTYQGDQLYRIDRFEWNDDTGNLKKKEVVDHLGSPFQITEYKYDSRQNPIEERIGDGKEWCVINRSFLERFNVKETETFPNGKTIHYNYVPETNLLASEFVYEGSQLRKRTFNTYDDCAVCIKTIIDDGSTLDPNDLTGVTYRKMIVTQPKASMPCFGLPEIVEEKTLDAQRKEALLNKVVYAYTPFGKVAREDHYDANGTFCYSIQNLYQNELLQTTIDAIGNTTVFTYDLNQNLTSISGPKPDQNRTIEYDKANRPICLTDPQVGQIRRQYNKLGKLIAETDACGNVTRFEYDSLSRLIATQHPDGAVERKEYDILGNVTKIIDGEGYETRTTYNYQGKPLSIYYPDGKEEHFTYNSDSTIASHIDKNGSQTRYQYDIFQNPTREETYSSSGALLRVKSATFTPFCKTSETDGEGVTTFYKYDYVGRKIAEQIGNQITTFSYDTQGCLSKTDCQAYCTIQEYNSANQLISKRIEADTLQFQESYAYDEAGNRTQLITVGGIFETAYNSFGKPIHEKDPLNNTTEHSYHFGKDYREIDIDPKGIQTVRVFDCRGREAENFKLNLLGETIARSLKRYDKNGDLIETSHIIYDKTQPIRTVTHKWVYGPSRRIERFNEAGEKETVYLYDAKGRLQTIIKPNGDRLSYEYDDLGRLSRYFSHDFDYHYTYDLNDCLLTVYDSTTQTKTTRTYDTFNNIVQEDLAHGLSLYNSFDNLNRRVSITLPDDSTATYSYDGAYLKKVQRDGIKHVYAERDLDAKLVRSVLPGNLGEVTILRDVLGRWQKIDSSFYKSELYYDTVGNLIQNDFQDALGQKEVTYKFDDLDQLISEQEHTYHYDSLYNRLKKDELEQEINTLCQITHDGQTSYKYDANGNLISDGFRKFSYDSQDRLIAIEEDHKRIEYAYDSFHRRLWKKEFLQAKQVKYDRYLWDGDNEIGVVDEKGTILELRILGEGLGAEIGAAVLIEISGKVYVPLHDIQGSVIILIDLISKTPSECYRYTAFGEELSESSLSPWRFSSKRTDEGGLVFFGRRYYHPKCGRWITKDPEGFENGPNLYAYVSNCPLTRSDLYGLSEYNRYGYRPLYIDYERKFWNKCCSYDLSILGKPELSNGYIFFANGMLNKLGEASRSLKYISDLSGGYNIHGLYNPTHGFIPDVGEAYLGLKGIRTNPVQLIKDEWSQKLSTLPADKFALHICHSKGAIYTNHALQDSPDEIRKRIRVIAIAPADYISRDICHSVQHYEAPFWRDPIPRINWKARWQNRDSIIVLPSHPNASWHDHPIQSPTFEGVIKREIDLYFKDVGQK